ncbi:MAG: tetratricopeptide repeat protein, partial [Bryobacteraceae bacterium]
LEALRCMLAVFGEGKTTAEAVREALGLSSEELDARFLAWLERQLRVPLEGLPVWREGMKRLAEAARAGRHEDVLREGPVVRDLYPDYVEAGSAYELLAAAYLAAGDMEAARRELAAWAGRGGRDPALLKQLAALEAEAGRKQEAAQTLECVLYVASGDEETHRALGDLLLELGQPERAIREYRVVLALGPADVAAAHYNLARACWAAQRLDEAREHVLAALEAAPGYRPAQKLLLELNP